MSSAVAVIALIPVNPLVIAASVPMKPLFAVSVSVTVRAVPSADRSSESTPSPPLMPPIEAPLAKIKLSLLLPPPSVSKLVNAIVPFVAFATVPLLAEVMFQVLAKEGPMNVSPPSDPPPINDSMLLTPPRFCAVPVVRLTVTGVL